MPAGGRSNSTASQEKMKRSSSGRAHRTSERTSVRRPMRDAARMPPPPPPPRMDAAAFPAGRTEVGDVELPVGVATEVPLAESDGVPDGAE